MPNIPTRERPSMPTRQNLPPRNTPVRPLGPHPTGPRPTGPRPNMPQMNMPPRVVNDPRRAPSSNINYKQLKPPSPRNARERVSPIQPQKKLQALLPAIFPKKNVKKKKKKQQYKERTVTHEFMLGFFVGMLIFGVAAIFICTALIGLFT